jgi:hypothetical protein
MDASSPIYAALGATGFEALDDLSHWLDAGAETIGAAESDGRLGRFADRPVPASIWEA